MKAPPGVPGGPPKKVRTRQRTNRRPTVRDITPEEVSYAIRRGSLEAKYASQFRELNDPIYIKELLVKMMLTNGISARELRSLLDSNTADEERMTPAVPVLEQIKRVMDFAELTIIESSKSIRHTTEAVRRKTDVLLKQKQLEHHHWPTQTFRNNMEGKTISALDAKQLNQRYQDEQKKLVHFLIQLILEGAFPDGKGSVRRAKTLLKDFSRSLEQWALGLQKQKSQEASGTSSAYLPPGFTDVSPVHHREESPPISQGDEKPGLRLLEHHPDFDPKTGKHKRGSNKKRPPTRRRGRRRSGSAN